MSLFAPLDFVSETIVNRLDSFKESERMEFLKETLEMIKEKPIKGYGLGSWRNEINKRTGSLTDHKTPHNNYLYVWMELGILGITALFGVFFFNIKELYKRSSPFIFTPLIFLILMTVDNYFISANGSMIYVFLSIVSFNYQYKPS